MTITDFAQLGVLALTAIAVYVTLKGLRDQLWLQTFTEYTRRYNELMDELPEAARLAAPQWQEHQLTQGEGLALDRAFRRYMHLCSEEYFLHLRGRIDRQTWDIWRDGMQTTMALPSFRGCWDRVGATYAYFSEFHAFMSELVSRAASEGPTRGSPGHH